MDIRHGRTRFWGMSISIPVRKSVFKAPLSGHVESELFEDRPNIAGFITKLRVQTLCEYINSHRRKARHSRILSLRIDRDADVRPWTLYPFYEAVRDLERG